MLLSGPPKRYLAVSNFVLSEDARKQIRLTLEVTNVIEREYIDDVISHIDASLGNAGILEESGKSKESRSELAALHKSIVQLLGKIRALSLDSKLALDDYFNEGDDEQSFANQIAGLPRQKGERLDKLQIYAEAMEKAAVGALSNIRVKRGARPNFNARSIAFHLRESLEDFGINVTSYDVGPYMAILHVALSELVPTEKDESYRRHGLWAISVTDLSEVDLTSMTVDNEE